MSARDDGGPAYPTKLGMSGYGNTLPMEGPRGVEWVEVAHGMTLRDYFAGQAPVSFETARKSICGFSADADMSRDANRATVFAVMALARYEYADAMLAERSKP